MAETRVRYTRENSFTYCRLEVVGCCAFPEQDLAGRKWALASSGGATARQINHMFSTSFLTFSSTFNSMPTCLTSSSYTVRWGAAVALQCFLQDSHGMPREGIRHLKSFRPPAVV